MRVLAGSVLVLALALAGCGDDPPSDDLVADDPDAGNGGTTSSSRTSTGNTTNPPATGPTTHESTLSGNSFEPGALSIRAGDTVRWTHADGMSPHNVEAEDGSFDSHPNCTVPIPGSPLCMTDGDTYEHTFAAAGTFTVLCQVHNGMTQAITVS